MPTPFLSDFDTLLAAILADYRNQFPAADTSQGSLIFIKSACLASALWGLYRYQDWICRQIFPDTADSELLEHHANIRGLARRENETDAELLARLLDTLRNPPAGGNQYDYVQWAKSISGVADAVCVPAAQGPGTVDLVILASGESEIPDSALLDEVFAYIETVRPVGVTLRCIAPTPVETAVTITVDGDVDTDALAAEITAFLSGLRPGDDLTRAQLTALCINAGAADVLITLPAANVVTADDEMIRPGTVTVAEA